MTPNEKNPKPPPVLPSRAAWMEALKELEQAPITKAPVAKPAAPPAPKPPPPSAPADTPMARLREAEEKIAATLKAINKFVTAYPYLIAPNVYRMWEDSLRETAVTMERQRSLLESRAETPAIGPTEEMRNG